MDAADKRMLEREALRNMIQQWNANRLDLFELSEPNENLEFHGVMRFYFQDSGQKIATKCIRVASDATVSDVIETLIEKFRPDMRMLSLGSYSLWETHGPDDERKLEPHEKPLLVQLNWHADDREGRFLLKCLTHNENAAPLEKGDQNFKRKLSKREKKELKKKEKLSRMKSETNDENRPVAEKLYTELPETSFTRSISNPEAVMRRRRQQKLERKLQLFRSKDGGPDTGGTLKIYGSSLCPDVPYKTLLLSVGDTAAGVVRETLDKYGLSRHDPHQYCIVQVDTADNSEYILEDDECPLAIVMTHHHRSSIMFHVRRRPADAQPRRRKKKVGAGAANGSRPGNEPALLEVAPDGAPLENGRRIRIADVVEVGSGNGTTLQLYGPSIQPRHCVVAPAEGGGYNVTPLHTDALVLYNGRRVLHPQRLQHGCLLKFGRVSTFRFVDPAQENLINRNLAQSQQYGSGSIYDRMSAVVPASRPGQEAILPAVLEFPEAGQAAFLAAVISRLDPHAPAFKLAPVYTLYLCARYRASTHYRPELTPTERAHKLTAFLHHVATLIHATVQERCNDSAAQAFWMANASELLHFLKCDRHISSFSTQAQDLLPTTVQNAFSNLVSCFQEELSRALSTLTNPNVPDATEATAPTLQALAAAMVLLRRCRVNAALTIQLFSHLFHYINSICFNKLVTQPGCISARWGAALSARLGQLAAWAERQGLELAADCHLARTHQAARLIQGEYRTPEEVRAALAACFKLNSVQVRALLAPLVTPDVLEAGVQHARALADELCRADGREIVVEESSWLGTALLVPGDGFSAEVVRGVPPGLAEFVAPLQRAGLCRLAHQPSAIGVWTVYMTGYGSANRRPPDPRLQIIQLNKNSNGMGLSIVAAKGAGQSKLGIYIKSVVPGGAAAADGRLAAGDQLLSVDGHSLVGITQEKAAEYLVRTGPTVTLEVAKQGAVLHGLATLLHQPAYNQRQAGGVGGSGGALRRASERDLPARLAAEPVKPSKSTPALHHAAPPATNHPPNSGPVSPSGSAASAAQAAWALKSRSSHNLTQPSHDAFYQNLQSVHSHASLHNRLSDVRSSGGSARPQSTHLGAETQLEQAQQQVNQMTVRAAKLAEMSEEVTRRQQQQQQMQQQQQQLQHQQMMQQQMYQQKLPHQHGLGSPLLSQSQQTLNTTMSPPNHQPILSPHMHMHTGTALYQAASAQQSPYSPHQQHLTQQQQHMPQSPHLPPHQQHLSQQQQQHLQQQQMPQSPHLPHQQLPHGQYGQSPQQRYDWHPPGPPSPQRTQPPVAPKPQGVRRSEPEMNERTQQQNTNAQVDDERYVASALEPPSVNVYPASASNSRAQPPPAPAHNPWQREQRERQQEARVQANRQRRDAAIAHLVSLGASRTPVQNQQLRALQLERDFERRATQHDQDDAVNTEFIDDDDINEVLARESPPPAPAPAQPPSNPPQPPKSILKTNRTELTNGYTSNDTNVSEEPRIAEITSGLSQTHVSNNAPPPPSRGSSFAAMASHCRALSPLAPPAPPSPRSQHDQPPHSPPGGRDKRVSFHELAAVATPPAPPAPATSPPSSPEPPAQQTREDPDRFITEAENMLAGASQSSPGASPATSPHSPAAQPTPGVIGAQEVYRDPRARRLAEKNQRLGAAAAREPVPETLSFHEKMKLFALEAGDPHTPKDKVKISRAQRDIDAVH